MRILIADDEATLTDAVEAVLNAHRYETEAVHNGCEALDYAMTGDYDLLILDVMMPGMDGVNVMRALRARKNGIPVLMLSARSELDDRVGGLDAGADDYLTKPFAMDELLARVRALTRRKGEFLGESPEFLGVRLDPDTSELRCGDNAIRLGGKEYAILELLARNAGIMPKERIMQRVWGYESEAEYNTVEVYVSFLRKKLTAICAPFRIVSVRGAGYRLERL